MCRLIPARAGRTSFRGKPRRAWGAHPRSCGADVVLTGKRRARPGSSPLVRGGRHVGPEVSHVPGLIPARAGRTSSMRHWPRQSPAHPRSCGADVTWLAYASQVCGSSPLVRGGLLSFCYGPLVAGLIPARAGRTLDRFPFRACPRAHPRSCGADGLKMAKATIKWGSSPLVRGGPRVGLRRWVWLGLIPARAGRTPVHPRVGPSSVQAHPRSCGADEHIMDLTESTTGSSPLVRGGRWCWCLVLRRGGLIPARAGRTISSQRSKQRMKAHPRSCGADGCLPGTRDSGAGSSPLVRGGLDGRLGH